jgi:hypothetical protein
LKRITSINQIVKLAEQRRAVWWHPDVKPKAAAFFLGMPVRTALLFIQRGLYVYKKKG